jgi:hypothetical protein
MGSAMSKETHPVKGSWEFRFFALVSRGGGEGAADSLQQALLRARDITGVDLSSCSGYV